MTRTGVGPEGHEGVVFDELELADLAFLECDRGKRGVSGGADAVDRIQDGAIDVDCYAR